MRKHTRLRLLCMLTAVLLLCVCIPITAYADYGCEPELPKSKTYTLIYDANGGVNAPKNEVKTTKDPREMHRVIFTISQQTPTREGYEFVCWNIDRTIFLKNPGDNIFVTSTTTLKAVWRKKQPPATTYTVTYTDGVEGKEVFADDVHSGLLADTDTPAFKGGTPTRYGYVFAGWNPEWEDKVTKNVIYAATWDVDANNNGVADKEEDKYTVTYTDGVVDEVVFEDDVHSDLLAETDTPAFTRGTPTRDGYDFIRWEPSVAYKVTANATYTAVWEEKQPPATTYTVTYTDGVEGEEIFADDVHSGLLAETATPEFKGTLTREGYVFAGWTPKWENIVTKNVTYVATWTPDSTTPVEECTVVVMAVTDGDKVNAEEIFRDSAVKGTNLLTYLNDKVTLDAKEGYTLDKWFNWDNYGNKFADDTLVNGWTNVYVTYTSNNSESNPPTDDPSNPPSQNPTPTPSQGTIYYPDYSEGPAATPAPTAQPGDKWDDDVSPKTGAAEASLPALMLVALAAAASIVCCLRKRAR